MSKRTHNATQHGVYAHDTVLPWEDAKEFTTFHANFRRDLAPSNAPQEEAVRELASLHWRMRRLGWGKMLPFYKDPTPRELMKAAKGGVKKLGNYLGNHIETPEYEGSEEEEAMAAFRWIWSDTDEDCKQDLDGAAGRHGEPPPPDPISKGLVALAYDAARMEQQLKIEAMLESRITKVMACLIALKEYERLYGQKSLPAPSASD